MEKEHPEWLDDIQNRSWEPEMFVSGGAIFFLLQVNEYLHRQGFILMQKTGYYEPILISNFVISTLNALIFGFALHLIIRGFWVASITLSYVFPKGIQLEKIDYAPIFQKRVKKIRDTVDWVIYLEKVSSLMFTLSFFFAMMIISLLIVLMIFIPHQGLRENLGDGFFEFLRILGLIMIGLGGIYALDFLTLGFIKKQKRLAKVYYPIYWFFSLITLSGLYRTTYYTLVSNTRPWVVIMTAGIYVSMIMTFTMVNRGGIGVLFNKVSYVHIVIQEHQFHTRYYDNLRNREDLIEHLSIQSDMIQDKFLRLFIVHQRIIERLMAHNCTSKSTSPQKMLTCYQDFYKVLIDSELQKDLTWRQYTHPETGEEGIITYIPLEKLSNQPHLLKIVLNISSLQDLKNLETFGLKGATYAEVPFWKN